MDLEAARAHFAAVDPVLHAATRKVPPLSVSRPRAPYAALLRAIVGQQLSTRAASTIWGRVADHFGGTPTPEAVLATEPDVLRGLGLSYRKAGYIQAVAREAAAGRLVEADLHALDDAEIVARLTEIPGVGRWTVQMILMFGMQRPDVFAAGDLGIRQAMVAMYGLTEDKRALTQRLHAISAPWSPHRTVACRLLWRWKDARDAAAPR